MQSHDYLHHRWYNETVDDTLTTDSLRTYTAMAIGMTPDALTAMEVKFGTAGVIFHVFPKQKTGGLLSFRQFFLPIIRTFMILKCDLHQIYNDTLVPPAGLSFLFSFLFDFKDDEF